MSVIYNKEINGFGNHNLNFELKDSKSEYFIVCNPDLISLPSIELFDELPLVEKFYFETPLILDQNGNKADYLRSEISFITILMRFFVSKKAGTVLDVKDAVWVPSVFKIFSSQLFEELGGYDENIFMYYEDYDICKRATKFVKLKHSKYSLRHIARRNSRKSPRLLAAHLKSVLYVLRKKWLNKYAFKV